MATNATTLEEEPKARHRMISEAAMLIEPKEGTAQVEATVADFGDSVIVAMMERAPPRRSAALPH